MTEALSTVFAVTEESLNASFADDHDAVSNLCKVFDALRKLYRDHKALHGIEPTDEVKGLIRTLVQKTVGEFIINKDQFAIFALRFRDPNPEAAAYGLAGWFYNFSFMLHGKSPFEWFVCYVVAETLIASTNETEMERVDY